MRRELALLLCALTLAGCATSVGTIPAEHTLQGTEESVVVGRVEMVRPDGQPLTPAPAIFVGRMSLTVVHQGSGKTYAIGCDTRGFISDFYVSLPAGRYRLTKWESANLHTDLRGAFEVAPRQVVYVGTLRFTGGGTMFTWQGGAWAVIDGPDSTLRSFRERFPQIQQPAVKALIGA